MRSHSMQVHQQQAALSRQQPSVTRQYVNGQNPRRAHPASRLQPLLSVPNKLRKAGLSQACKPTNDINTAHFGAKIWRQT